MSLVLLSIGFIVTVDAALIGVCLWMRRVDTLEQQERVRKAREEDFAIDLEIGRKSTTLTEVGDVTNTNSTTDLENRQVEQKPVGRHKKSASRLYMSVATEEKYKVTLSTT